MEPCPTTPQIAYIVTSSTSTSVTYSLSTNPGTWTAGGSVIAIRAAAVTGATWSSGSGGQATLTFASTTAPFPGTQINVASVSPSGYNGTYTVVSSSSTSVTYAEPSNPGTYSSGGELNDVQDNQTDTTYEPDGQIATTTSPDGEASSSFHGTTSYTYDAMGNQITQTDPGTVESVTGGSCSSNVATLTWSTALPNPPTYWSWITVSGVTPSQYNGTWTISSSTTTSVSYGLTCPGNSPSGGLLLWVTKNFYDPDGNISWTTDAQGTGTDYRYDLDGRQLAQSYDALNQGVSSATCGSNVATITHASTSTPVPAGATVFVQDVNQSGYNWRFHRPGFRQHHLHLRAVVVPKLGQRRILFPAGQRPDLRRRRQ